MTTKPILLISCLIIMLTACNNTQPAVPTETVTSAETAVSEVAEQPLETPTIISTESPSETFTLTPTKTNTPIPSTKTPAPEPTATSTLVSTATALPTKTPTITPTPEPMIKVGSSGTINVRAGPGLGYPVVTQFEAEAQAMVIGQNEAQDWWQVALDDSTSAGWVFGEIVTFEGNEEAIPVVSAPPLPPTATPDPAVVTDESNQGDSEESQEEPISPEELAEQLQCDKDFCVTYQAMVPIGENGGCVGNHSIYITVLQGPPPGQPMDGVVIGDTFNNVEVASGSHGPGRTEITLWSNSMILTAKRHIDDTPYTSQESFNFTSQDELIPAEILAANGYCEGSIEKCEWARNHNQVCRGHYSWRVTFHKFN